MADIKLPEIRPIRVASAAGDIERAGAQFAGAMDEVGAALSGFDKASILADAHAAEVRRATFMEPFHKTQQENPTLTYDEVAGFFPGGQVPPEVENLFTRDVQDPNGKTRREVDPNATAPFYRIAPDVFRVQSQAAREAAAQGITGKGWQTKFLEATTQDDLRQFQAVQAAAVGASKVAATAQLQSAVEYHMAAAARGVPGSVERAMAAADAIPLPAQRVAALEAVPKMQREVALNAALNAGGTFDEQREAARAGMAAVKENTFARPLSADEQAARLHQFQTRLGQIDKAEYDGVKQGWDEKFHEGFQLRDPLERQRFFLNLEGSIPAALTQEDYNPRLEALRKAQRGEERENNMAVYASLRQDGDRRLRQMSIGEVLGLAPYLNEVTHQKVIDLWGAIDKGKLQPLPDFIDAAIYKALELRGYKNPKDANNAEYFRTMGTYGAVRLALDSRDSRTPITVAEAVEAVDNVVGNADARTTSWAPDSGYLDRKATLDVGLRRVLEKRLPPGTPVTSSLLADEQAKYEKVRPQVEAAWDAVTDGRELPPQVAAQIYGDFTYARPNVERTMRERALAAGKPLTGPIPEPLVLQEIVLRRYGSSKDAARVQQAREGQMADIGRKEVKAGADADRPYAESYAKREALPSKVAKALGLDVLPGDPAFVARAYEEYNKSLNVAGEPVYNASGRAALKEEFAPLFQQQEADQRAAYEQYAAEWRQTHPPLVFGGIEMRNDPPSFDDWKKRQGAR